MRTVLGRTLVARSTVDCRSVGLRGPPPSDPCDPPVTQLHDVRQRIVRDADVERVPPWLATAVFWGPLLGGLGLLGLYVVRRWVYYRFLQEDYPVEWGQFALCLFCALIAVVTSVHLARRKQYVVAVLLLLVGLCTFFLAGEEISWGQRVFDLATPGELATVNQQSELNVHNVIDAEGVNVQDLFKVFSFLMGAGGVALALLTRGARPRLSGRFWQLIAPPVYALPGFAMMPLYRLAMLQPLGLNPLSRFQEWVELSLYLSLSMTMCCIYLRARPVPAAPKASRGSSPTRPVRNAATRRWAVPFAALGLALLVTVVFAVLTIHFGLVPGNVTS